MKIPNNNQLSFRQRSFVKSDQETVLTKKPNALGNEKLQIDHVASIKENWNTAVDEFTVGVRQLAGVQVDAAGTKALATPKGAGYLKAAQTGLRNLGRSSKDGIVDVAMHSYNALVMGSANLLAKAAVTAYRAVAPGGAGSQ